LATVRQQLGALAELIVVKRCACPRCKRARMLKRLPPNFKCADVICDFCGYLAQVKAATVRNIEAIPDRVLGGAWGVQKERMDAGIYFPLFLVLVSKGSKESSVHYLSADVQRSEMFLARLPLSQRARRAGWVVGQFWPTTAGWQGFSYDLRSVKDAFVRLA
jgi:Dam-replacing family